MFSACRMILGHLARGSSLMLAWQLARAVLQGGWGIALARILGPEGYGFFAGFAGLATAIGALTGIGFGLLMLQKTSRHPARFPNYWAAALLAACASAMMLLGGYLALAPAVAGQNAGLAILAAIAIPELACFPIVVVCSYAFQAHDRMGWAGAMYALVPAGNVCALAIFLAAADEPSLAAYLQLHLWTAVGATTLALIAVQFFLRPVRCRPRLQDGDSGSALGYTLMRLADTGLASIDKTLVLRIAGSELAGQYTAAYRLAALVALPVISLAVSVTPRLFRESAKNQSNPSILNKRLLKWGLLIGLSTIPATWVLAHLLPWLFGPAYEPAGALARQLPALPALLGLTALGCSALMTQERRVTRTVIQTGAILALLLLMPRLFETFQAVGAVWAVQLVYTGLAAAAWWVVLHPKTGRPNKSRLYP